MRITASAVSLNVADECASAEFLIEQLGFREEMAAEGFVSLGTYEGQWPPLGLLAVALVTNREQAHGCVLRQRGHRLPADVIGKARDAGFGRQLRWSGDATSGSPPD